MKGKLKKYRWIFQLIISISIALYIYFGVDYISLISYTKNLPLYTFILVPIIGLLQVYITTIMQIKLFSIYSNEVNKFSTFKENFTSAFYGSVVPGLLGSDLYMVNYFGKKVHGYFNAITGILLMRILSLVVFLCIIFITSLFLNKTTYQVIRGFDIEIGNSIVISLSIIGVVAITSYLFIRVFFKTIYSNVKIRFRPLINLIKSEKKKTVIIVLYILLYYIVAIGGRACIGKISGINLSFIELSVIIMVVSFLIILPVSYIGIGIREVGYIGLLVLFGIDKSKAILLSMMDFSITIFVISVGTVITLVNVLDRTRLVISKK